ncbi:hypothetical protein F5Y10DRAFT_290112 [Nemania abortiva]|nr:hypothetical protein F5Y10DRAFT_290112 [Nemania abortiva]
MVSDGDGSGDGGALLPPRLHIDPPLFNSANPWATTLEQLRALHACEATGAVTTRTALLGEGFPHDDAVHQYAFFEAGTHRVEIGSGGLGVDASLNTLGYSPILLEGYLGFIKIIDEEVKGEEKRKRKPFIVSVTGTPDEVAECYRRIAEFANTVAVPLAMEVNLSCPNIPGKPPPAYEGEALRGYVRRITEVVAERKEEGKRIPWGLKTPPYTHAGQFEMFVSALRDCAVPSSSPETGTVDSGVVRICPVSFVTATNTLGSCLLLGDTRSETKNESESPDKSGKSFSPALPGLGIGGVAGAPLHPLALGNVATLRRMLDAAPETRHVAVLGIGGVADAAGYKRMRSVGAAAVGVGTALGIKGVAVFGEIEVGLGGVWGV